MAARSRHKNLQVLSVKLWPTSFSQNPESLAMQELERLRFCVNRALEHREQNLKGELLKGTIIESQLPSESSSDAKAPMAPKSLESVQ